MEEFHYFHIKLTFFLFDKDEHILQYHSKPYTEQSDPLQFLTNQLESLMTYNSSH